MDTTALKVEWRLAPATPGDPMIKGERVSMGPCEGSESFGTHEIAIAAGAKLARDGGLSDTLLLNV
jgi:hypothetical protein